MFSPKSCLVLSGLVVSCRVVSYLVLTRVLLFLLILSRLLFSTERSSPVLLTKKSSRRVLTWPQRGSPKKPLELTHFQFENRSRTTCPRFLQSFALPKKAVQFSAILTETLEGISNQMVRLVSLPSPPPSLHHHDHHNNTQHTDTEIHTETETETQRQNPSFTNDLHVRHVPVSLQVQTLFS